MLDDCSKLIQDFLTLLQQEKAKENSALFGDNQAALAELRQQLIDTSDELDVISIVILEWAEGYPAIEEVLNKTNWVKVRSDMVEENEEVAADDPANTATRLINKSVIIAAIDEASPPPENTPPSPNETQPHD